LNVAKTPDLGTGRNTVPTLQHHDLDFLLHGQVLWPSLWAA
jgi:hypothetical protein